MVMRLYASTAPFLKLALNDDLRHKKVEFENGSFSTNDPDIIKHLDDVLNPDSPNFRPNLAQLVRVVDVARAEAIAKQHQLEFAKRAGSTVAGQLTADAMSSIAQPILEAQRQQEIDAFGKTETARALHEEGEMTGTVSGAGEVVRNNDLKPITSEQAVQPGVAEDPVAKNVAFEKLFNSLGSKE